MTNLLSLAAGGAIGTIIRYTMSGLTYKALNSVFPWGTLCVNLTGSFIIGILWGFFDIENLSPNTRNFVFVGILGGFTTFSTFTLESFNLLRDKEIGLALANILASNILGIVLVFAGFLVSRHIINFIR
ncbi:MAG: fluoride efflux transporter CrcB [Nitrospiraceae bacterium]|nr:MAG: fluoride efflux transporter CrcB [Nitrospiraceae bacterium]